MAISEAYVDTGTSVSTTEYDLPSDSTSLGAVTTDGVYQCFLDLNALAAGDTFRFTVYEKVYGAATQRKVFSQTFYGAQVTPVWASPSLILLHGWTMSLIKVGGTDRSIAWSIRSVA